MVRILTNPGANLPPESIASLDVHLTSSNIMVDGTSHDCRDGIALAQVDEWVANAKEHPYVLGTSAAEFAARYVDLGALEEREILVMMSSRKIIQSYDAACSAIRTLAARTAGHAPKIRVVDSTSTDLGLGLPVLAAARAIGAGFSLDEAAKLAEAFAARGRFAFVPRTLDNLVRGGRASFLRGFLANMLRVRPLLAFVDGEAQMQGKCGAGDDHAEVIADWLAGQVGVGSRVWAGVAHGGVADDAARLVACLHERFDVELELVRTISPSVYLHAGPRALGAVVFPSPITKSRPRPPSRPTES